MFVLSYLTVTVAQEYILKVACCIAKRQICNVKWCVFFWGCCLNVFPRFFFFLLLSLSLSPLLRRSCFLSLIFFHLYMSLLRSLIVAGITFNLSLLLCQPANCHLIFSSWAKLVTMALHGKPLEQLNSLIQWITFSLTPSICAHICANPSAHLTCTYSHIHFFSILHMAPHSQYQRLSFAYSHTCILGYENDGDIIRC